MHVFVGVSGAIVASVMALVEPLYCRTLQYVLPLISPLMRSWEVALTEEELKKWKANDSVPEDGKEGGTVPPPTGDGDPTAAPQVSSIA